MESNPPVMSARRGVLGLALAALAAGAAAQTPQSAIPGAGLGQAVSGLFDRARTQDAASKPWNRLQAGDKAALNELIALARQGNHMAQLYVGYLLDNGEFVTRDSAAAAAYFNAAAPRNQLAAYDLGLLYLLGRGVSKDEKKAMALFEQACKDGIVEQAAVRLAQYHLREGNGQEAWKWADVAANVGNSFAYFVLGKLSLDRRDYGPARLWLEKAAQGGERNAPALLSRVMAGVGGSQPDYVAAASWDMISAVLNGRAASPVQVARSGHASRLTDSELGRARSLAADWLNNHGAPQAIQYSKTIFEHRRTVR